jgi:tetratricopeptide (TPR) repeat protein
MATHEEIESVLRSGTSARRAGRLSEALQRLNEAAALCGPDQEIDRACVLRELGELARARHDLSAARARYEEAVALLRGSDRRLMLAHTIRHLGDVHVERRQWPEAEQCFVEALGIYRTHAAPGILDLANAIRARAVLKTETGQREEARALWTEAQELYASESIAAGVEECRRRVDQLGC